MPEREPKSRKRARDEAAIAPRPRKRVAKSAGIQSIPTEMVDRILGEVALAGDERSAAKNLMSVELVGTGFQNALRASPVGSYRQSLTDAGKAAKRNYAMLPRGKFREGGPLAPYQYVDLVGPGLHLLTRDEQSTVVNKVLSVGSPWRRAEALNKIGSYPDGLSEENGLRLLGSALNLVERPEDSYSFHACKAVAKLYAYRTPKEEARMADLRVRNPILAAVIDGEVRAIGRRESTSTVAHSPDPSTEVRRTTRRVLAATEDLEAKVRRADAARTDLKDKIRERDVRGA
jgi:hypothetical protein